MYRYIKRFFDVFCAFIAIVLLSPLMAVVAIAVKTTSKGPVLFKQKRIGKNKRCFQILKFRTMRVDTPKDCPTHLLTAPDAYITSVGRFLRKTSLDELPQLFNIFVGQMSVVGPRPALWNQADLIAARDLYGANDIRPGLTGWAQINGRDELPIDVKAKLDGVYVERLTAGAFQGFAMDVKCLVRTVLMVLKSDGVVEGGTGKVQPAESEKVVK